MPDEREMYVTNPFKHRGLATAFVVKEIRADGPITATFGISWYSTTKQAWRDDLLPTRGEYLIKRGGNAKIRSVTALLKLESPYIVTITNASECPVRIDANAKQKLSSGILP